MHLVQNIFLPYAAMIAAEAIGAFGDHGVEVDTTFTRSSLDQRSALLAGEADVAVTALDNLFAWNQCLRTSDFKAIAQIERATSLPVYLAAGLGSMAELAALERPRARRRFTCQRIRHRPRLDRPVARSRTRPDGHHCRRRGQ